MCYQPPPGASLSHSAAASLRLGPGGSLSTALARAQPLFPPSLWPGWQVGTGDKGWGLWGRQVHAPCPLPGQEHGVGGRSIAAQHLQGSPSSHHPASSTVERGLRLLPERQRQGRGGRNQAGQRLPPALARQPHRGERPGFTGCKEAKGWWLCPLPGRVCWARLEPNPSPQGQLRAAVGGREWRFVQGESIQAAERFTQGGWKGRRGCLCLSRGPLVTSVPPPVS